MNLRILIGCGRGGKSTYAHKVEKTLGYKYIGIDEHYHYGGKQQFFCFLDFFADLLNNNPSTNFVLDGYLSFDKHFDYLKSRLKHHEIESILVFTNYKIILERDVKLKRGSRLTKEEIVNLYREYVEVFDFSKFVEGDGGNKQVGTSVEVMRMVEDER